MQSISANSSNDNIDPSKFTHFVKPREYFKYIGLDKIVSMFDFYELQMDFDEADNFVLSWEYLQNNQYNIEVFCVEDDTGDITPDENFIDIINFILDNKKLATKTSVRLADSISTHKPSTSGKSMDNLLRSYYRSVFDSDLFDFKHKFRIIYVDLVIPQLVLFDNLSEGTDINTISTDFTLNYSMGNPYLQEKTDSVFTAGRLDGSSFKVSDIRENLHVSRCNFIVIKIRNELFVLSGWSLCGTRCSRRENISDSYIQYEGNQSFMRFNEDETFQIEFGDEITPFTIMFNPKHCVVCLEKKCEVRGDCQHATLCEDCYDAYMERSNIIKCPICRTEYAEKKKSICVRTYNPRDATAVS
jgi:hypothetical protein